jgi:macrodomain Ter protein organizer (MatP/YcbG family)
MAKTAADRQRAYRERHRLTDASLRRVEVMLPSAAHTALRCLAQHRGQTMAECIRQLVEDADRAATQGMTDAEFDQYAAAAARRNRMTPPSVTG